MSQRAALAMLDLTTPRTGIITSYDPKKHAVKVAIQPEGVEIAGWIPLGAAGVGNGFGIVCGPNLGDMVQIAFDNASPNAPRIVGRFFSNVNMPPAVPSGDTYIVHKSGSALKFNGDGSVNLITQSNLSATVGGSLNANVTGAASVTSSSSAAITAPTITLGSSGQTLLQFVTSAFMALFNGHTHTSASAGSPTSIPIQQMSSSHMTSTVRGG
jgi:hypothetical protein